MATFTIAGTFVTAAGPTNGAVIDVWKASRFGGIPAQNSAPPGGSADAGPVTAGPTFGGPGAYQVAAPTNEQYYVRAIFGGNTFWALANEIVADDTTGDVSLSGSIGTVAGPTTTFGGISTHIEYFDNDAFVFGANGLGGKQFINAWNNGQGFYFYAGNGTVQQVLVIDGSGNATVTGFVLVGSTGSFRATGQSASSNTVLFASATGDTNPRFLLNADGSHWWGPGSATQDVRLYRNATNQLLIDNTGGGQASLVTLGYFQSNSTNTTTPGFFFGAVPTGAPNFGGNSGMGVDTVANLLFNVATGKQVYITRNGTQSQILDDGSGNATFAGVVTEKGTKTGAITSGALSTTTFTSGTGKQILTTRDVDIVVPWTGGTSAATLVVAISPDNVTYSTLITMALPASSTGTTIPVPLTVPAGWWVKLTNTNGTIGTATFY